MHDGPGEEIPGEEGVLDIEEEIRAGGVFWRTRVGNGGWVRIEHRSSEETWWVLARVEADKGGRLRIMELYLDDLDAGTPVTSQRLRRLPLGRIEQMLNLPEEREGIATRLDIEGIDIKAVAARHATTPAREPTQPLDRAARDKLRRTARHRHAADVVRHNIENRRPLAKPDVRPYPAGFYQQVAEAYRAAQRQGVGPGPFIAAEAGVPRTTAAFWVREARRRGYLGPATRGKTGETGQLTVRYVGPKDAVEMPLPDGRTLHVSQGGTARVPTELAFGLLPQATWEPVPQTPEPPPDPQQHPNQPQGPPEPRRAAAALDQPPPTEQPHRHQPSFQGGWFG